MRVMEAAQTRGGSLREKCREQAAVAARHGIPANRTVDLGKFHKDLETRWQIELQPVVTSWDEHAKDARRFSARRRYPPEFVASSRSPPRAK
jgi:hypothetical protein